MSKFWIFVGKLKPKSLITQAFTFTLNKKVSVAA